MSRPALHAFETREAMVAALAAAVAARLESAVAARGEASLVVPGGTTPAPLFAALREAKVPWEQVVVTLSDERWVDVDDPGSNEGQLRAALVDAVPLRFAPLKTDAATPGAALDVLSEHLGALPLPFDAVVLGMGNDGHVASLFPGSEALGSDAIVCAVEAPGAAGAASRVSLTLPALLDSRWIALMIQGRDKLETYMDAALGGSVAEKPVRALLQQSATPVEVFWAP